MKKLIIGIVLVFVVLSSGLKAQEKPFIFGFKIAPNIGWMNPSTDSYEMDGSKFGFSWGLLAEFYLMDNYSLNSGINIVFQNGTLKYDDKIENEQEVLEEGELFRTYNFKYIQIPLTLKMKTNEMSGISFFGVFGFGANVLLSGQVKDKFIPEGGNLTDYGKSNFKDDFKSVRASMIIGIGAEFNVDGVTKIIAGVNFDNGITDVLKNQNLLTNKNHKSINNYLEFYIGIMF